MKTALILHVEGKIDQAESKMKSLPNNLNEKTDQKEFTKFLFWYKRKLRYQAKLTDLENNII